MYRLAGKWFIAFLIGAFTGFALAYLTMAAGWLDPPDPPPTGQWGSFSGTPKLDLFDSDRDCRLLEDFSYTDGRRKIWTARQGAVVNGASIPKAFWTIIGGPLEGKYRYASIVHDAACEEMKEPWDKVHQMFYEACRCAGLRERRAKVMYAAVHLFGPRWEAVEFTVNVTATLPDGKQGEVPVKRHRVVRTVTRTPEISDYKKLVTLIYETNPSIEAIKSVDPGSL